MNDFQNGESYESQKTITARSIGSLATEWDLSPKTRPSEDQAVILLKTLQANWAEIAGEIADFTYPVGFSGSKLRKLRVKVTGEGSPPWGAWDSRGYFTYRRRAFTRFRLRVNQQLDSHEVDHVEFLK